LRTKGVNRPQDRSLRKKTQKDRGDEGGKRDGEMIRKKTEKRVLEEEHPRKSHVEKC